MSSYFAGPRPNPNRLNGGAIKAMAEAVKQPEVIPTNGWREATDRPDKREDGIPRLANVAIVAMTDRNYLVSTQQAVDLSCSRIQFATQRWIREGSEDSADGVVFLPPEAFGREQGSVTLMAQMPVLARSLPESVTHLLVVQHDGFVCNPAAWTDEFLEYDYIGAPWPDDVVGNSGFWLTSRKFWEAVDSLDIELTTANCHPLDVVLCRRYRKALEEKGIRWAPLGLAHRFSVEGARYEGQFGFHGHTLVPHMVAKGFYERGVVWDGGLPGEREKLADTGVMTRFERAVSMAQVGRLPEAAQIFEELVEEDRNQHEAARHLAKIYADSGHSDKALPLLEFSRAMRPEEPARTVILANTLNHLGYRDRAGQLYEAAIARSPETPYFHWCYALWLLGQGRIKEGYREYRWSYYCRSRMQRHPSPEWDGTLIPGKRLYVCGEQGYGDAVMMSRFLPLVKERSGAHVILECHEPLVSIFLPGQNVLPTGDEVVVMDPNWEFRTKFDHWINPFTIPYALGLDMEDVQRLDLGIQPTVRAVNNPRRIGLCWKGAAVNAIDRTRSTPVDTFAPLMGIPGVQWVSLQYGEPVPEGWPVEQPDIRTMDRTVRVIQGLDAVVSVDTMVGNLAATLGVTTHLLTTVSSDYRWGVEQIDGNRSPWYAAARVYRQQHGGDYEAQVQAVKAALIGEQTCQKT